MSIVVDPTQLAGALQDFGSGYLLTVSSEGVVKAVTVDPVAEDGVLRIAGPSRGSAKNLADNPSATVIFPPAERHGYTLIVDGSARVVGDGFEVAPSAAVLHRPSSHADGPLPPEGCGHDCRPVG